MIGINWTFTMNAKTLLRILLFILINATGKVPAAEYFAGQGIGYGPWSFPWLGRIVFDKKDAKAVAPGFIIKTGDDVTPPPQRNTKAKFIVPPLNYISWCNSYSNPLIKNNEDFSTCYGNAQYSHWYVLDLNKLHQQGLKAVWISVAAERYPATSDSRGLVPALTLFKGHQTVGSTLSWYPQTFQTTPSFWANELQPFTGGRTRSTGWATAYGTGNQNLAEVSGWVKLRPGGQNFLTVAVGGDAHRTEVTKTTVNEHPYALVLRVSKTKPEPAVLHTAAQLEGGSGIGQGATPTSAYVGGSLKKPAASEIAAASWGLGGVTLTINNNLGQSIQLQPSDSDGNWVTVDTGTSWSSSTEDDEKSAYLKLSDDMKSRLFIARNLTIGWPMAFIVFLESDGRDSYDDISNKFDEGESFTATDWDGITWTVKRNSDGGNGNDNQKNFTLTLTK